MADPLIKALKNFLLNQELPRDPKCQALVKLFANDCFIEDGLVWRRIKRQFEPSRVVLFLPVKIAADITRKAFVAVLARLMSLQARGRGASSNNMCLKSNTKNRQKCGPHLIININIY